MYGDRDRMRNQFLDAWQKARNEEPLSDMEQVLVGIIRDHPEYHALLNDREKALTAEFPPESGTTNPFLHMSMHMGLREQAATDRPAGIRDLHRRLCARYGELDAEHRMMECLGQALWESQRSGQPPDEAQYLECLKRLEGIIGA